MYCLQNEIHFTHFNSELFSFKVVVDMKTLKKFCLQFLQTFYADVSLLSRSWLYIFFLVIFYFFSVLNFGSTIPSRKIILVSMYCLNCCSVQCEVIYSCCCINVKKYRRLKKNLLLILSRVVNHNRYYLEILVSCSFNESADNCSTFMC